MNADKERDGGGGGGGAEEAKSEGPVEQPGGGGGTGGDRKSLENDSKEDKSEKTNDVAPKAEEEKSEGEEDNEVVKRVEKAPDDEDTVGDNVKKDNDETEGEDAEDKIEDVEDKMEEDGADTINGDNTDKRNDDFKSVANKIESDSSSDSDASPIPSPPPSAAAQLRTPVTPATDDPNFAVVCAFLEKFGAKCNLECPSIGRLQEMLEASNRDVKQELITFQCRLLRKLNKSITTSKWEKAFTKFAFTYSADDGWELERFGYKNAKMGLKVRLIKNLMEAQFDVNPKFKSEVNNQKSSELRSMPLGTDKLGNNYWHQLDAEANLRIYKEDVDEETWELVARNKTEFEELLRQLKEGPTYVKKSDEDNVSTQSVNEYLITH